MHRINLKQTLNHGLVLIKINQNAWLNPYIDINVDLREKMTLKIFFLS